jgi:hypothetical protein
VKRSPADGDASDFVDGARARLLDRGRRAKIAQRRDHHLVRAEQLERRELLIGAGVRARLELVERGAQQPARVETGEIELVDVSPELLACEVVLGAKMLRVAAVRELRAAAASCM